MNQNGSFATVVIPRDFTASLVSLAGQRLAPGTSVGKPTIQFLANRRAGAVGVQLAQGVLQPAIAQVSQGIGKQLLTATRPTPLAGTAAAAVLASPITFESVDYRPLPPHTALGLSAFYIALLTLICGFLTATIINATVDAATGYTATEIGPRWQQRAPLPINRWQTLLTKLVMAAPVTGLLTALMLVVAVGPLGMRAPDVGYLWLFTWLAAVSVAAGTLVLFAAFGTQGQLIALLLFVYLGLASAGGTVPLQALPGPFRLVSQVEPLRQILDGTRSILYFGSSGPAGLTRGIVFASVGLIIWLVLGISVVRWYDRRGLHRIQPDLLAYVQGAVSAYQPTAQPQSQADTTPSEGNAPHQNDADADRPKGEDTDRPSGEGSSEPARQPAD
jgi:hypothetical protein